MQQLSKPLRSGGCSEVTATKLAAPRRDDTGDTSHWREVGQSRRRFRLQPVNPSAFVTAAGERLDCDVHNLSPAGARISLVKGVGGTHVLRQHYS